MWSSNISEEKATSSSHRSLTEIDNLNVVPDNLFRWNLIAAIFQFVQAGALFYLSSAADTEWSLFSSFPLTLDDREGENGAIFGVPGPNQVASYSVTWYSAVFILLSGFDHLAVILPGLNSIYKRCLERSQNPFRWIEYSVSASLMRVMIAQLSGVTDIHLLFSIFTLAAMTMIGGWMHEIFNAKARADGYPQNWFPFLTAFIPHMASWAIIFCYFFVSVSRGDPPGFVYSIVFILFVLDGTFALLFWLQWAKIWRFENYVYGEKSFIILSFTAKALLAWINYGGGSR